MERKQWLWMNTTLTHVLQWMSVFWDHGESIGEKVSYLILHILQIKISYVFYTSYLGGFRYITNLESSSQVLFDHDMAEIPNFRSK